MGRTPAQCLERYEKLLDAAAQRDEDYDPADDPRRLRPGEIDPNPESKPARPDAVDMDEDEKEMLSEARARLANTKGKKAKRKAREKQLEEARRLASLQKKRELKAAGIETVKRAKRAKGLDYNAEIAFEKKPAPGFYDVSEERAAQPPAFDESAFKPVTMEEMEGPRKKDLEEQLRKQDAKRAQIAERHDALGAARTAANLNDPGAVRRRNALVLPAPRVSERELEEIAKLGRAGGRPRTSSRASKTRPAGRFWATTRARARFRARARRRRRRVRQAPAARTRFFAKPRTSPFCPRARRRCSAARTSRWRDRTSRGSRPRAATRPRPTPWRRAPRPRARARLPCRRRRSATRCA